MPFDYFDLHCDTATEIYKYKETLNSNRGYISLDKISFDRYIQVFAFFLDENYSYGNFINMYDYIYPMLKESKIDYILSIENAGNIIKNEEDIVNLKKLNIKMVSLCYNKSSMLCGGVDTKSGLSNLGKAVIPILEKHNIVIDVSHANEKSFWDIAKTAKKPIIASHSNAKAVCDNKRNLTDEQIKHIINSKGLIGINFHKPFVGGSYDVESICRHIMHILSLGGEKTLAIGSDFDGCDVIDDIKSANDVLKIANMLLEKGVSKKTIKDIFFTNAANYFTKIK